MGRELATIQIRVYNLYIKFHSQSSLVKISLHTCAPLSLGLGPWSGRALLLWSDSLAVASQLRDQREGRENGAWNKRNKNGRHRPIHSTEIISAPLFTRCFGIHAYAAWLERSLEPSYHVVSAVRQGSLNSQGS